jgi:hypothetical protein
MQTMQVFGLFCFIRAISAFLFRCLSLMLFT